MNLKTPREHLLDAAIWFAECVDGHDIEWAIGRLGDLQQERIVREGKRTWAQAELLPKDGGQMEML